jgi:valyl-tRNA synthetase
MEVMKKPPFENVYIHGLVRDSLGRKMSKSLGNGIDPLEIIEKYGADPLRFSLVTGNSAGNDMRFYWEKVESARNFCNKVYNAARFVLMNIPENAQPTIREELLDTADKWILSRLNEITREVTDNLDDYELNLAAEKIYDFIWAEFCDWYIEMAKSALYGEDQARKENVSAVLIKVLGMSMKLLHPFMPFITEELYQQLPGHEETIMLSAWPKAKEGQLYARECAAMETIMDLVKNIRNIRADLKVPPAQRIEARIITADPKILEGAEGYLFKLAGVEKTSITSERGQALKSDVHIVCEKAEAFIPLASLVDLDKERERIDKEIDRVKGDIARAQGKLSNEKFVSKAPEAVVNEERRKLQAGEDMLQKLQERRDALND